MIQDQSRDLTLIVYNTPNPPRYLKLNKNLIRSFFIIVPTLVVLSITLSFLYSMFLKNKILDLRQKEPKIILELKKERDKLASEIKTIQKNNQILTRKLSLGSTNDGATSSFGLLTPPLGLEDLREKELIKFENTDVKTVGNQIVLTFDLANNSPNNDKLSGYISVIQYQGNMIQYFPNTELGQKDLRINYTDGESFSFSRFRPTKVEFVKTSKLSAQYKILIFSRTGNLIALKQIGPFNIE